jgi:hypothetical protein
MKLKNSLDLPGLVADHCDTHIRVRVFQNVNHWVMHPVARVSTNICRNLRTQQMSVLVYVV